MRVCAHININIDVNINIYTYIHMLYVCVCLYACIYVCVYRCETKQSKNYTNTSKQKRTYMCDDVYIDNAKSTSE